MPLTGFALFRAALGQAHTQVYRDPGSVAAVSEKLVGRRIQQRLPLNCAYAGLMRGLTLAFGARNPDASGQLARARREFKVVRRQNLREEALRRFTTLMDATIADAEGDAEQAAELYAEAATAARDSRYPLYAQVCRVRRAQLVGGTEGTEILRSVREELLAENVAEPLRFINAMLPGVIDPVAAGL